MQWNYALAAQLCQQMHAIAVQKYNLMVIMAWYVRKAPDAILNTTW